MLENGYDKIRLNQITILLHKFHNIASLMSVINIQHKQKD